MSNLWGLKQYMYLESGFAKSDLKRVNMDFRAANKNKINIVGAFEAMIEGQITKGRTISSPCLIYISDTVNYFFFII